MHVILTHENADFDAIASLLGAHKLYPNARPVLPRRVNSNVQSFLALYGAGLPFVDPDTLPRGQHVRRVILVDTQSLTYVRGMSKDVNDVLVIDHHTPPDVLPVGWRFQGETLGATTTLLVEALSARLTPISRVEATLMLAGIYEDTGSLTYAATSSRDLRAAAWLVEKGASLEVAAAFLEHPLTPMQQTIYDALKEHVETLEIDGHPVALSWAKSPPNSDEEVSTLAHKLRDLLDPSALFVLVEINGNTQFVARSSTDDINVAEVAAHFGGGGHDRAAAAFIRHRHAVDVFTELRDLLPDFVRPRVKVHNVMSLGVRTVRPNDPIHVVAQTMLHTGHEGFPVVGSDGTILGLVTRNAVDRAKQHQWEHQPVERVMQHGAVSVSPDDSVERVRTLMIQTGWGQIPVVEKGQLIGVVTRTDLIRLPPSEAWEASAANAVQQDIIRRMEQYFPAPLLALIRQIGELATEQGYNIYFVGGIVRDLLLGHPLVDVDIVVEGRAITLGKALAEKFGGEIHVHSRFGTVKWTLPQGLVISNEGSGISNQGSPITNHQSPITNPQSPVPNHRLPEFIDLVTARTEFYEHPTALPLVERSSIKQDLHRRDFTINTLAIRLDPQRWGELLDFYGGKADLDAGVIRVLHSLSFIDDPTRILRAARFEARLGFHLDLQSESLIANALPMLDRITGGRIRHELDLIFQESQPEAALDRLQTLGALAHIQPELVSDAWLHERFVRLRQPENLALWNIDAARERDFLYWGLFLYRLPAEVVERLIRRMLIPRRIGSGLRALPLLHQTLPKLEPLNRPGQIVTLLEPLPSEILPLAWLASDNPAIKAKLERYASEWRHVQCEMTGKDLKKLGLPPSPAYRHIFETLRAARLDGEITTREEEEQRVNALLAQSDFVDFWTGLAEFTE